MPSVHVSFLGVCTIFQNLRSLLPRGVTGPKHRVVLVRNTPFMQRISGIDPHIPKIQFVADHVEFTGPELPPAGQPNAYSLSGVTLSVFNPANNPETILSMGCLPSLQRFLDPQEELGPPAEFVYAPMGERAAAWFDVDAAVSWEAYKFVPSFPCSTVPAISMLTVETSSAPQLLITPWDGTPSTIVTLTNDDDTIPNINVMNFADGEVVVDDDKDFFLNYLCAANFPLSVPGIPRQDQICTNPSPLTYQVGRCGDAGPGCSNTNYP
jgi:hypothetical protein